MSEPKVFYYSRRKLALYLLFNVTLLLLAVFFTLTIFPEYPEIYYPALLFCAAAVLGCLFVLLVRRPLAVISDESIKIDRARPVLWKDIAAGHLTAVGKGKFQKTIITLTLKENCSYELNLVQKLSAFSDFGAYSIPLYAMDRSEAEKITKELKKHLKTKMK